MTDDEAKEQDARCPVCGQLGCMGGAHCPADNPRHVFAQVAEENSLGVVPTTSVLLHLKAIRWAIRRQAIVSGVDFPTPALDADIKKAGEG